LMLSRVAIAAVTLGSLAFLAAGRRRPLLRRLRRLFRAPPPPSRALLQQVECIVFDCDGVLYRNSAAISGVPEALDALRAAGKRLLFVTNAASASRASLAAKLGRLGFAGVAADDCVTSASAAASYLATAHPEVQRAYVVGGGGLLEELRAVGAPGG